MKYMGEKKKSVTLGQIVKQRDCKRIKYNASFGHNTGLKKKMGMTCKQNASLTDYRG
jgi:hypothetical protein